VLSRFLLCLLLVVAAAGDAAAQSSRWIAAKGWDGEVSASLFSLNTLSTGSRVIDYHPQLVISCREGRYPVWRQAVRLRTAIGGSGDIEVVVRLDNGGPIQDLWTLADAGRTLRMDGSEALSRLARAKRFRIEWSNGFFSGKGEAIFDLGGLDDAIDALAADCGARFP
jgi:hypothetical protein